MSRGKPAPTGIHVDISDGGFTDAVRCSIGFELDGMRGHIWAAFPFGTPEQIAPAYGPAYRSGWIYFNPPAGIDRGMPGYFPTRTCRLDSKRGAAILAAVLPAARGLAAAALEAFRAKEAADAAFRLETHKRHAMLEAIDENFDAVITALGLSPAGVPVLEKIRAAADAVTS